MNGKLKSGRLQLCERIITVILVILYITDITIYRDHGNKGNSVILIIITKTRTNMRNGPVLKQRVQMVPE